jgi:hypothetical protein
MTRTQAAALLLACLLAGACGGSDDECPPAFEPGDRFLLTVLGYHEGHGYCDIAPLVEGDMLTLTAGTDQVQARNQCQDPFSIYESVNDTYDGDGQIPEPFKDVFVSCDPLPKVTLGQRCWTPSGGTTSGANIEVSAQFREGADVLYAGRLTITWTSDVGSLQCRDQYVVRIQRVAP